MKLGEIQDRLSAGGEAAIPTKVIGQAVHDILQQTLELLQAVCMHELMPGLSTCTSHLIPRCRCHMMSADRPSRVSRVNRHSLSKSTLFKSKARLAACLRRGRMVCFVSPVLDTFLNYAALVVTRHCALTCGAAVAIVYRQCVRKQR